MNLFAIYTTHPFFFATEHQTLDPAGSEIQKLSKFVNEVIGGLFYSYTVRKNLNLSGMANTLSNRIGTEKAPGDEINKSIHLLVVKI